jgi:hypothetical protein
MEYISMASCVFPVKKTTGKDVNQSVPFILGRISEDKSLFPLRIFYLRFSILLCFAIESL